jgi:hypothetical protein
VINMPADDRKRSLGKDLLLATVMVVAGLTVSGLALTQLRAAHTSQMAQATPPLQSTPGADTKPSAPPEPATTGARPTGVAPEPAQPDPQAQKEGAKPTLPPAPAEKMAPPIQQK